ncbi:MAG: UPF0175 family protein [Chloroflexota bacterium]
MQLSTFEVSVPQAILSYGFSQIDVQKSLTEWLVIELFTGGHVSAGKAAQLLAITKIQFFDLLRQKQINYIDYTPEEIEEELAAVQILNTPSQTLLVGSHVQNTPLRVTSPHLVNKEQVADFELEVSVDAELA